MKSNDLTKKNEIRARMQAAVKDGDTEGFYAAMDEMLLLTAEEIRAEYDGKLQNVKQEMDSRALTARGVRQLTGEERTYYQKLATAMKDNNPKQAVANLDVVMPETVIDSVFEDLRTNHPLLSLVDFTPTGGATKFIVNKNGYQEAAWGPLCAEIVKELTSGFAEVDTGLLKLSAFLPVCNAMLDVGPEWLDRYVRAVLYEALANGMEAGIVDGTGKDMPVGMTREVGEGVVVTGGVYPKKKAIKLRNIDPASIGNLLSLLAINENGKTRRVNNVIFITNPQDYFQKVMPATTLMAPDGSYRNDVMPYPMTIVQSPALQRGEAVIGLGKRYFAGAGMAKDGRIEYSDEYHFLEDERVYKIKTYANGFPKDNNAFLLVDISELAPATWKVEKVEPSTAGTDATLSGLRIGNLALSPAFAEGTDAYTATTTNASNAVTAVPADANAEVHVVVNDAEINNGAAAAWKTGSNTVEINVTAQDGNTTKTYTVTVTKS